MELKSALNKLKYHNEYNGSALIKETLANINHIKKSELLDILEFLNNSAQFEFKIKIISILTAYLLCNSTNRDIIIKNTSLYETLCAILARGLPASSAVALNFSSALLCEEGGGTRGRTLTLLAQNTIRTSGCLAATAHLFTNCMLPADTWKALCRCLADVCSGSEPNQTFCSYLVPLCIRRCLQGNTDVLPVIQSLLLNHKRNINLFMESDGAEMFKRIRYLRLEACLQLLTTVIQSADAGVISIIKKHCQIYKNLQDLLKMCTSNTKIVQWTTIALYYLDTKSTGKENNNSITDLKNRKELDKNDTQLLLQNIMSEVLSCSSKIHNKQTNLGQVPKRLLNVSNVSRVMKENEIGHNYKGDFGKQSSTKFNSRALSNGMISFSFLKDKSLTFHDLTHDKRYDQTPKHIKTLTKITKNSHNKDHEDIKLFDTLKSFDGNITNFTPIFVSTPKRLNIQSFSSNQNVSTRRSSMNLNNKSRIRNRHYKDKILNKTLFPHEKTNIKQRSMSSRLFEAINESCTTVIKSVKNVFIRNKKTDTQAESNINKNSYRNEREDSLCSYSFTNYMRRREEELQRNIVNVDENSQMNTMDTASACNTCDDTLLLRHKLANDKQLKTTVKKLKLGINLYGCDFKRISKTMWPREKYMTPNVLYKLYRKLILK